MFDRMKKRLGFAGAAEPVRADPMPRTHLVPVPIIRPGNGVEIDRPEASMGYLDRNPDSTRQFVGATPVLRTADAEIRRAWGETTAHARHLFTQSGFLSGGIELACAWTVGGDGLQPSIKPDAYALGWSEAFAKTWANNVEARFKEWAHDPKACDAQGRQKFGAMQNAALKSYFGTGDILAVLDYGNKQGTAWKTSLSLIDPTRLWVPGVNVDRRVVIRDGVEFDDRGRPIAYHIRPLIGHNYGNNGYAATNGIRIPVYSNSGKQLLLHAFDGEVGAVRGISPLAAAIQSVAQSQNVHDAAVLASHIASMVVGVVTSDLPTDAMARSIGGPDGSPLAAMMESRTAWHEGLKKQNAHLQLGHGAKIAHLSTGERFEMLAGKVPFTEYERIIRLGLAEAARALGLSPEALHGMKDGATYSSLKVAATEMRAIIDRRRKILIEPLCEYALTSIVEEMIADGQLRWPGNSRQQLADFRSKKHLALKVEWVAASVEDPDALKSVRAAVERVEAGMSSLSDEIAATGRDPETVMRQRQHDEEMLTELGMTLPWTSEELRANRKGKTP